jgi:DNA-directed RNA polymerase specialized sigma24 family protein
MASMGYNGRNIAADERPEPSAQDQEIFEIRLAGKSPGDIAKALHMPVKDVDAALVRACPLLDA